MPEDAGCFVCGHEMFGNDNDGVEVLLAGKLTNMKKNVKKWTETDVSTQS